VVAEDKRGRGSIVVTQKEALKLLQYCPQSYTVNVFDYVDQQFMRINAGCQTLWLTNSYSCFYLLMSCHGPASE
jgi:hypothetical protein